MSVNFLDTFFKKDEKKHFYLKRKTPNFLYELRTEIKNLIDKKNKLNNEKSTLEKEVQHLQELKQFTEGYLKDKSVQARVRKSNNLEKEISLLSNRVKKMSEKVNQLSFQKALLEDEIEELTIKKNNLMLYENISDISIEYIDNLTSGIDFEKCFSSILKALEYTDIKITSGTGDFGIDVLAKKEDVLYGFQCKLYSKPVGNNAIQQAYSGKKHYNCNVAIVVTNSTFTRQAKEQARELQVVLWDRNNLKKKIEDIQTL